MRSRDLRIEKSCFMLLSRLPNELGGRSTPGFSGLYSGYHLCYTEISSNGHVGPDLRSRDLSIEKSCFVLISRLLNELGGRSTTGFFI